MFSHITVGVSDLDAAAAFYDAILLPLGLQRREVTPDGGPAARCWVMPGRNAATFLCLPTLRRATRQRRQRQHAGVSRRR